MRLFRTFLGLTLVASTLPTALAAALLYRDRGNLPAWTAARARFSRLLIPMVSTARPKWTPCETEMAMRIPV